MLRWKSANGVSPPARMYVRDCEGEDFELLDGLSGSLPLSVEGGRLTCENFVCRGESWDSEGTGSLLEETSSCVLLFASAMSWVFWFNMDRLQDTGRESGSCIQEKTTQIFGRRHSRWVLCLESTCFVHSEVDRIGERTQCRALCATFSCWHHL